MTIVADIFFLFLASVAGAVCYAPFVERRVVDEVALKTTTLTLSLAVSCVKEACGQENYIKFCRASVSKVMTGFSPELIQFSDLLRDAYGFEEE